jgi:hypothetical protein
MNWLAFVFAFQLGCAPNVIMSMYDPPPSVILQESEIIISFDAEIRAWDLLYVGGNVSVPMWKVSGITFFPNELQSIFKAGLRYKGIEIGWSHLCVHPVVPYLPLSETKILWEGNYDEFHLKFSGEVHF